jgi:hypothetical protein
MIQIFTFVEYFCTPCAEYLAGEMTAPVASMLHDANMYLCVFVYIYIYMR